MFQTVSFSNHIKTAITNSDIYSEVSLATQKVSKRDRSSIELLIKTVVNCFIYLFYNEQDLYEHFCMYEYQIEYFEY
jgi:hypothetical protein